MFSLQLCYIIISQENSFDQPIFCPKLASQPTGSSLSLGLRKALECVVREQGGTGPGHSRSLFLSLNGPTGLGHIEGTSWGE